MAFFPAKYILGVLGSARQRERVLSRLEAVTQFGTVDDDGEVTTLEVGRLSRRCSLSPAEFVNNSFPLLGFYFLPRNFQRRESRGIESPQKS